jgi:hypothetical protein
MKVNKDITKNQKVIEIFEIELLPNLRQKLFIWSITLRKKRHHIAVVKPFQLKLIPHSNRP